MANVSARQHRLLSRDTETGRHSLGGMDVSCIHCHAKRWVKEMVRKERGIPIFGNCCSHGKVRLTALQPVPAVLRQLWLGNHPEANHFKNNAWRYNSIFQMASSGARGWGHNLTVQMAVMTTEARLDSLCPHIQGLMWMIASPAWAVWLHSVFMARCTTALVPCPA